MNIPKKQSELTAITNDQVEKLIRHTNDADTLVIQIQKAADIKAASLMPLFKWTNDLHNTYQQPFYKTIIRSYEDVFNEISKSKAGDTTLLAMKTKVIALQKENLALMQQYDDLNSELKAAKAKKD